MKIVTLFVIATGLFYWWFHTDESQLEPSELHKVLSQNEDGFQKAKHPIEFQFPQDHNAHPAFRSEWWYVTANLVDEHHQEFGVQFTLFRSAALAGKTDAKDWFSPQFYLAHIAVTQQTSELHLSEQRLSRQGPELAGAEGLNYWLWDWQLKSNQAQKLFPATLVSKAEEFSYQLQLEQVKPITLQGDKGLSTKGQDQASYYYSFPRLKVTGQVTIKGKQHQVSGLGWYDHEWSTSILSKDQQGWDWFSIHLNNGWDLMYFRIRNKPDSQIEETLAVKLIDETGKPVALKTEQVQLTPIRFVNKYPVSWELLITDHNIQLNINPLVEDQEITGRFNYWEGAIKVSGSHIGSGYLELTGYH